MLAVSSAAVPWPGGESVSISVGWSRSEGNIRVALFPESWDIVGIWCLNLSWLFKVVNGKLEKMVCEEHDLRTMVSRPHTYLYDL